MGNFWMTLPALYQRHKKLWRDPAFPLSILTSAILFGIGVGCVLIARNYLLTGQIDLASSPDFILDRIPVFQVDNFMVWGVELLIACVIIIFFLHPEYIPFTLKTIGLLYFIRAFFVVLTPMGIRLDQVTGSDGSFLQDLAYGSNDFFFSGHVAFPFLLALIFWNIRWIRVAMLLLSTMFAVTVLLTHTHYSIDVFAVPFIMPTIHMISKKMFPHDDAYTLSATL